MPVEMWQQIEARAATLPAATTKTGQSPEGD